MESPASRNNEPVALRNGNSGREERVAEGCIGMDGNQASQKKFRACRLCRRQKMKCVGNINSSCARCRAAGSECIFDIIESKKSKSGGEENDPTTKRIQSLEFEIQTLRDDLYSLTNRDTLRSSKMRRLRSPQHDGVVNQAQSMAFATPEVVLGSPEALSGAHDSSNGDVIAQGILSENQGRQLFEMYFARCNVSLPIFDRFTDTFDSLRNRSPLCFAALLSVAALLQSKEDTMLEIHHSCRQEAERQLAKSLFSQKSELETVQAIVVLAAYSEHGSFALEHAVRLAQNLGLNSAVFRLLDDIKAHADRLTSPEISFSPERTRIIRQARTWLAMVYLDWVHSLENNRIPTIKGRLGPDLRAIITHFSYPIFEIHILLGIELFELQYQFEGDDMPVESDTFEARLSANIDCCYDFWEEILNTMCYGQESFERVFCSLRRRNVELNLLCSRAESLLSYQFSSATISQLQSLLRRICLSIQSILSLIFDKQSYLWLLAASPVNFAHEAVSLVSILVYIRFQRPLLNLHSDAQEWQQQLNTFIQDYPFATFLELRPLFLETATMTKSPSPQWRFAKLRSALMLYGAIACPVEEEGGQLHNHAFILDNNLDKNISLEVTENTETDIRERGSVEQELNNNQTPFTDGSISANLDLITEFNPDPLTEDVPIWTLAPPYMYEF